MKRPIKVMATLAAAAAALLVGGAANVIALYSVAGKSVVAAPPALSNRVFVRALAILARVAAHADGRVEGARGELHEHLAQIEGWAWLVKHGRGTPFTFEDLDTLQDTANKASASAAAATLALRDCPELVHLVLDAEQCCKSVQTEVGRVTKAVEGRILNNLSRGWAAG